MVWKCFSAADQNGSVSNAYVSAAVIEEAEFLIAWWRYDRRDTGRREPR
jgi:hypothetical protein